MIKYLIIDVDGTLTDGKIYMGANGEVMKAFSVKDGYAFNYLLKPAGIVPVILTARTSPIVQQRSEELGIKEVYQGIKDKLAALKEIVGNENIGLCAYFGDDLLDLECMLPIRDAGGIVGCPYDAMQEVKAAADYVCVNKAGEGALREFAEWMVRPQPSSREIEQRIEYAKEYLKSIDITEKDVGKKKSVNDNFFYTVQSYQTKPENECKFESHRKYVDVQIVIEGEEAMDIADVSRLSICEEYSSEKDVMFWNAPQRMARVSLKAGDCIVLYPENAHRGAIAEWNSHRVLKIVGKVRII